MKRLLPFFAGLLLLTACGGSSTSSTACTQQYWDGTVGMCLTDGWRVLEQETLAERGVSSDVLLAFQSQTPVSGQFPTITVVKENFGQPVSSTAYSEASIRAVTALPGYTLVDTRNVTVDGEEVQLHIYNAQPLAEEPARRFYQLGAVSKNTGYTFTALTPVSVADNLDNQIVTMLSSATFTAPAEAEADE